MKKKLRLRKEIKMFLLGVAVVSVFVAFISYGIDRIGRINDGEMIVISESYMD